MNYSCRYRKPFRDIAGRRFGRLVVKSRAPRSETCPIARWNCKCDCGKKTVVFMSNLTNGNTLSCGCLKDEISKLPQQGKPLWRSTIKI